MARNYNAFTDRLILLFLAPTYTGVVFYNVMLLLFHNLVGLNITRLMY